MDSDDSVEVSLDFLHQTVNDIQRLKVAGDSEPERYINAVYKRLPRLARSSLHNYRLVFAAGILDEVNGQR
jgi:hypothetical protein